MKLKLLLFIMVLSGGILNAQDTIRTLIITESNPFRADQSYVEITNMGTTAVQLSNFKLGKIGPWDEPYNYAFEIRLPEKMLDAGKSYVIATVRDYTEEMYPLYPDKYSERITQKEYWQFADLQIHSPESNPAGAATDSVTVNNEVMVTWGGRDGWYLEQHISETDSVIVDQVGGVFDNNDRNFDHAYNVAGVTDATGNSILIRKFSVKKGNLDFANARGVGEDDSEWIVVPLPFADLHPWRAAYWTPGNHGNYKLDNTTLVSSTLAIDWNAKKITVPWGVRNLDYIMNEFDKKPGFAWFYDLSVNREDSAYASVRTGDKLTIYACGDKVEKTTFDLELAAPKAGDNIVIPKYRTDANGYYGNIIRGNSEVFGVTTNAPVMDTITNSLFGIGYATRVDTLMKYLEKAPNANWEIEWVDNVKRPDLLNGDVLKVTAENGDVKKYYIKVNGIRPSHNANLSAITWPDVPAYLKGLYGWKGDTIPNFVHTGYQYFLTVPMEVNTIPALVAKTETLNSRVEVTRATSLEGNAEQRTITFKVTAQDDTTILTYTVELVKEQAPNNIQPNIAEPFISEIVFQDQWANWFVEIANPGSQPLDLSNYMIIHSYDNSPAEALDDYSTVGVDGSNVDFWLNRYRRYIPGYRWVDQATWQVSPSIVSQDLNVSPWVDPGDVFVLGSITQTWGKGYPWFASEACDVIFKNKEYNPWNEDVNGTAAGEWNNHNYYLFKILNDSIKLGLKPATDINDFELIEVFGMGDNSSWNVAGKNFPQTATAIRKPEYVTGKKEFKESFGTNPDDSEWIIKDAPYWEARGVGWSDNIMNDGLDVGKHFMFQTTNYISTVTSPYYRVSEGYSQNETITGLKTGITATEFLANIVKKNENQTLAVHGASGVIEGAGTLATSDTLIVISADNSNTTKYVLNVSDEGMSTNAVITSNLYDVKIDVQPKSAGNPDAGSGSVSGFDYGTRLKTILANITLPAGAKLEVINEQGAYVPLKILNFDTTFVDVTVNDKIFLNVTAENGITQILYQLLPASSENDAFIQSDIYNVIQKDVLIEYVPRGTTVSTLLSNLVAATGASMKVVNNHGQERLDGNVADDDKVVVTSGNGNNSKAYYLAMLAEEFIPAPTYLAYILSNSYPIDQVDFKVDQVSGDETISSFLSKVTPAAGATAMVVDKDGMNKTTGDINKDDMVKVTSADGKVVVYYTFGQLVSARNVNAENIQLYPNPTNGEINISGVKAGYRIQVYNSVGSAVRDINVQNSIEKISLRNQPAGMYMIVVSDNNKMLGRYKALKQ